MDPKMYQGILNAPTGNRYKRFTRATVDQSKAWLLQNENGEYVSIHDEEDGHEYILVFSDKEFAELMKGENEVVFMRPMSFLKFVKPLTSQTQIRFLVMPNGKDGYKVDPAKLYCDYFEQLDMVRGFPEKQYWGYMDFINSLKEKMKEGK